MVAIAFRAVMLLAALAAALPQNFQDELNPSQLPHDIKGFEIMVQRHASYNCNESLGNENNPDLIGKDTRIKDGMSG